MSYFLRLAVHACPIKVRIRVRVGTRGLSEHLQIECHHPMRFWIGGIKLVATNPLSSVQRKITRLQCLYNCITSPSAET